LICIFVHLDVYYSQFFRKSNSFDVDFYFKSVSI